MIRIINRFKRLLLKNRSTGQTVFKNTAWLFFGEILGRLVRFFIVIYAARLLGVEEYGLFSYAIAIAAFMTIFSDIGVSAVLTRETTKNPEKQQEYFSTAFVLKLFLTGLAILITLLLIPLISRVEGVITILLPIAFVFAFDSIREFGFGMNRALEKMEREAVIKIIMNLAVTGFGFWFILSLPTAESLAFGYVVGTGVGFLATIWILRDYFKKAFTSVNWSLVKPIFFAAWPIGLLGVLGAIMLNTDMVMLGWWKSATEIGLYASAQKIILLLYVLPSLLSSAIFPVFSRLARKNNDKFRRILETTITASLLLSIPLMIGGLALAPQIIMLLFGAEYLAASSTFTLLLLTLVIVFPSTILANALFAYDEQKQFIKFVGIGAGSNILLNWLLIPSFGIIGVAYATIGSQLLTNFFVWQKMKQINNFMIASKLKKIVLASIIMGVVALILGSFGVPLLINIFISGFSYIGLLYLWKEALIQDIKLVLKKA